MTETIAAGRDCAAGERKDCKVGRVPVYADLAVLTVLETYFEFRRKVVGSLGKDMGRKSRQFLVDVVAVGL